MEIYVHFWAKHEDGRAAAGGFLRCETVSEAEEFADQCRSLGLAVKAVVDFTKLDDEPGR